MSTIIEVGPDGVLTLPAELRQSLGLGAGGRVVAEETAHGLLLRKYPIELYGEQRLQEFEEMNEKALEPAREFLLRHKLQ